MTSTVQFGSTPQQFPDGRLDAAAFHRNHQPILDVLARYLQDQSGDVLEIGSGTGQHVVTFARAMPMLRWWPSDFSEQNIRSILAWRAHAGLSNVQSPLQLDASARDWFSPDHQPSSLRAIFCANVVHISPWRVAEGLFAGAARYLAQDGALFLYGPFRRNGEHNSEGNASFDASLRRSHADWGVRDLTELDGLAQRCGLKRRELIELPANNAVLLYIRC